MLHSVPGIIRKQTENMTASAVRTLCKSMARLHLECGERSQLPHLRKGAVKLGKVQKRAAEMMKEREALLPQGKVVDS